MVLNNEMSAVSQGSNDIPAGRQDFCSEAAKSPRYKMKGVALLKVGLAIVIMLVIGLAVFYGGPMMLKRAKISNTRTELDQLRTAVMLYTATSTTGKAPSDFKFITSGYTDQAGLTVKDTVPKRWQDNGIVDPWGQAYTITVNTDGVTGTISSPGVPGDNTPISVSF